MIAYRIPDEPEAVVFDIDSTLYRHEEYARVQQALLIERLADELGISSGLCSARIDEYRSRMGRGNGGRRPSLGDTFVSFGIPIETSVRWREELIDPERYLGPDRELQQALDELGRRLRLVALTNNPGDIGRRTLDALGIERFFSACIGLEAAMRSKPDPACFERAAEAAETSFEKILFVGDRYEIDLEYPLSRGGGALLAQNMQDLYDLPLLLNNHLDSGGSSGETEDVTR